MSNWAYLLQYEHGVVFIHIEVSKFNKSVWKELYTVVHSLAEEYGELYACVPHHNNKVNRLALSLGATLIGSVDMFYMFVWEK